MRQIATLPEADAHKFADYLLTTNIKTQLNREPDGMAIWICDEDDVTRAREELQQFQEHPNDPRYGAAEGIAQQLRKQEERTEREYSSRQEAFTRGMRSPNQGQTPITVSLLLTCLLVAIFTKFGDTNTVAAKALTISSYKIVDGYIEWPSLRDLSGGEIWRLFTPMFLHFGIVHLLFNGMMLYSLGRQIEVNRGWFKYLLLILLLSAGSNICEYYLRWSLKTGLLPVYGPNPMFGGMSGVLYGLFGYMWMKAKYQPQLGLEMPPNTVSALLIWFVLCWMDLLGPIANVAHGVGLLLGVVIGFVPVLWQRRSV